MKASIFGAFDGLVTVLGILFALSATPHVLMLSGLGLAVSGAVSMGGGQWLSDNENGWRASAAIGATTGVGTLVPIVPYTLLSGTAAIVVSAVLCLATAGAVAWLKTTEKPYPTLLGNVIQTYSLLFVAGAATLLCAWLTGAVG